MQSINTTNLLKSILICAATFCAVAVFSNTNDNTIIAKVGEEKITYGQLSRAYSKNLSEDAKKLNQLGMDSIKSFLNLYSNYRLKVQDAIARGYHEKESTRNEIRLNQQRLTESELLNNYLIKPFVDKTAERRQVEFRMAYILFSKDSANSVDKANEVIKKLNAGEDFGKLAAEYSIDKTTSDKGGLLDIYITSGRIQPELEEALYSLEVGEYYKEPIDTDFGVFVLKLYDKEPRRAAKSAHILIEVSQVNEGDWDEKKILADSIYDALMKGADFEAMAKEFSGDPGSKENGGVLEGWYVRSGGFEGKGGKLVDEYEKALFQLKDGEISKLVKTQFGYHIIKRLGTKEAGTKEELEDIRLVYKRTGLEADKKAFYDSLYKANGYKLNETVLDEFLGMLDENKNNYDSTWAQGTTPAIKKKDLFEFNGVKYTVGDYIDQVNNNDELRGTTNKELSVKNAIVKIMKPQLLDKIGGKFYKEDEDYQVLADEFRDGILLYQVETEEVWGKLKFDSTAAKKYYNDNNLEYQTDYVVDFTEIYIIDEKQAKSLRQRIDSGEDISTLASEYTERAKYRSENGLWKGEQASKNRIIKDIKTEDLKPGAVFGPIKVDMGQSIIRIEKVEPPRKKSFEEAIPDFAGEFQDYRHNMISEKWINQLRNKYKVEIYEDKLKKIVKGN